MESAVRKIQSQEKEMHSLLNTLRGVARELGQDVALNPLVRIDVTYKYKHVARSRRVAVGPASQGISRRCRAVILPDVVEIDMVNCHFQLAAHIVTRLGLLDDHHIFKLPCINAYLRGRDAILESLAPLQRDDAKALMLKVLNGGSIPGELTGNQLLAGLQK